MACPQLNELLDYSRQLLPDAELPRVKAHLNTACPTCTGNLQWLSQVMMTASADRAPDFAEEHIKGLVAWFKAQPAHERPRLRRLVAQLLFDSVRPSELVSVRAEAGSLQAHVPTLGRQMLFQVEGYDIDLRFEALEDHKSENLIGQVLTQAASSQALAGASVFLVNSNQQQLALTAQADSQGIFRVSNLASGFYDVTIRLAEDEITLAKVPTACAQ